MKKTKNYIEAEHAKKKLARYKYWSIKDENSIIICSSDSNNEEQRSFSEVLDKIIADNVDAEVQIKFGSNEQSARHNPPMFVRVNQTIEWIEPEQDSISINGVPHKVDRNGNVNISLNTPENNDPKVEVAQVDTIRQEMDMQLAGLRKEYELREEKWNMEMHNKLSEQTLTFKEMLLTDREKRISEKEQALAQREAFIEQKEADMQDNIMGYIRTVPSALGKLAKEFIQEAPAPKKALGEVKDKPKPKRRKVAFSIAEDEPKASTLDAPIEEAIQADFDELESLAEEIYHDDDTQDWDELAPLAEETDLNETINTPDDEDL